MPFFGLLYQKFAGGEKVLPKQGVFSFLGELVKSIKSTQKKVSKTSKKIEKRNIERILDLPLYV